MNRPLKIGISARGLSTVSGGVRTLIEQLIPALARVDPRSTYVVFHSSERHRGRLGAVREVAVPALHPLLWEHVALPLALRREPVDVLFLPKTFVPVGMPAGVKTVIAVHDLLYFPLHGSYLSEYKTRDIAYVRLFMRRSIRRADAIVTISENTRRDVLQLFSPRADKVVTVHLGVNASAPASREDARAAVASRLGITKPYFFYPGSLSPRKNMVRVLEAFASISSRVPHDLVVTAGKSWKDGDVRECVGRLGLARRFHQLGHVEGADLPLLYRAATGCLYVSLYEGFGLPVLEAMSSGCPVLTSNTSSLPEVAGDAALLVTPTDTAAIAAGMLRLATGEALGDDLRGRGLARAAGFTWDRAARRFAAVFHAVALGRPVRDA